MHIFQYSANKFEKQMLFCYVLMGNILEGAIYKVICQFTWDFHIDEIALYWYKHQKHENIEKVIFVSNPA
jgi:hypothetical protein